MASKEVFSENKMGDKIDRCFSDAFIKFGKLNKVDSRI